MIQLREVSIKEFCKELKFESKGLNPKNSEAFKIIAEIDKIQECYEFTECCYKYFKSEMKKLNGGEDYR